MEVFKEKRKILRESISEIFDDVKKLETQEDVRGQKELIEYLKEVFYGLSEEIQETDKDIEAILLEKKENTDETRKEFTDTVQFRNQIRKYKIKLDILYKKISESVSVKKDVRCQNLNWPKLQIKKFDGNLKNWIAFWGQFKKIHEDQKIEEEDKFQYLVQAMEEGTTVRKLVESFPPSRENYSKAIDQLKSRFAREELLIEVYVRELLNLVLKKDSGMSLSNLYDSLETQIRALESLGVTTEKYAAMLFPLVESTLPIEILKLWERKRTTLNVSGNNNFNYLNHLLDFLKIEVESEQRITLAQTLGSSSSGEKKQVTTDVEIETPEYTAASLYSNTQQGTSGKKPYSCIFCDNQTHASQDCFKGQKLNLDQKKALIAKKKGCFACLKRFHSIRTCKSTVKCLLCFKRHFTIMCPNLSEKTSQNSDYHSEQKVENTCNVLTNETLLKTIYLKVSNERNSKIVRALLDDGSQKSYITSACAQNLKLNKSRDEIIIQGLFGGIQTEPKVCAIYDVKIGDTDDKFNCKVSLLEQQTLCNRIPKLNNMEILNYLKEKNILINDAKNTNYDKIDILLGADVIGQLLTGKIEKINDSLFAIETKLGWTIMGQTVNKNTGNYFMSASTFFTDCSIAQLWELDAIGIRDSYATKTKEINEIETWTKFKESTVKNSENRYEVKLPWIEGSPIIESNYDIAVNRLMSNTKKLINMNKFSDYNKTFEDWENQGIIEEVKDVEKDTDVHYLTHHAVIKESSATTKIRPVFNGSLKDKSGNSLNDLLEKGPNLIELIPPLIIDFRLRSIGVTADIAKAFLQISLYELDRDYLRFLWWKDYSERIIKVYRHKRVVFGLKPSPFLLAASLRLHLENSQENCKNIANKLLKSFYVDNCVTSVKNKEELNKFINTSRALLSEANFDLRGWVYSGYKDESMNENESMNTNLSILGLSWNYDDDTLFCDTSDIKEIQKIPRTKRGLLSTAQKVFDPIGITCPVSLQPKILLQEAWKLKIGWDTKLPEEIDTKFEKWLEQVKLISLCKIPRCITENFDFENAKNVSLHVFVDASKLAYAACIFIRLEFENVVMVKLLQAKTRISPIKVMTLPRLELMASVIGIRLTQMVKSIEELSNIETFYWSDSMVVLSWIKHKALWNTFVGNRVKEIRSYSKSNEWNHVPGKLNIADLLSRGCDVKHLLESKWWNGPEWLQKDKEYWPTITENEFSETNVDKVVHTNLAENRVLVSNVVNKLQLFSEIVRMIGWMMRFCTNARIPCKKSVNKEEAAKKRNKSEILTFEEIQNAEKMLFKLIQSETIDEKSLRKMNVRRDDSGILRVESRLVYGDFEENFIFPIVLPGNHPIVKKMIMEEHLKNQHAGVKALMSIIREKIWILKARKSIREVVLKCVRCKIFNSKKVETPPAPLPENRIRNVEVFEVTGMDLAGPMYLKTKQKCWIVIFTCAVYRAVHLEITLSLSTEAFLFAFRRFISRRRRPNVIYTDNGTNFVGLENQLSRLDWNKIQEFSSIKRIKWIFNPPSAPWWGGFWERLIRLVKDLLKKNLGKENLFYEELYTILCDIEDVINRRPLTYISEEDDLVPLCPVRFLKNSRKYEDFVQTEDLDKIEREHLVNRLNYMQKIRDSFRQRFEKEYLATLIHSTKLRKEKMLQVGDVVLIEMENKKRLSWPVGRVMELCKGRDGICRVAKLKTKNGILVRPLQRLFPLEVFSGNVDDDFIQRPSSSVHEDIQPLSLPRKFASDDENATSQQRSRYGREIRKPKRF